MYVKDVVVQNQVGLHARPATFFIQKANEFHSSIWVEKEDHRVNAKSLLGVLSLGVIGGTSIRIIADGLDEVEAVEALVQMVETGFDTVDAQNRSVVSSPAVFGKKPLEDVSYDEDELGAETGFDTVDAQNRPVVSSPAIFGKEALEDISGAEDELDTEDSES